MWLNIIRTLVFFVSSFLCYSDSLLAQWKDDFNTGPLDNNWMGDRDHFILENGQLKLSSPLVGKSKLYRTYNDRDTLVWDFYIDLHFATSSSNYLRFVLASDSADINKSSSYYIEIGETGSTDKWKLIAKDKSSTSILAEGEVGKLGGDPVLARFNIKRVRNDSFYIKTSYDGSDNYTEFTTCYDSKKYLLTKPSLGLECYYTDTRKDKFYFDEIAINFQYIDTTKAVIVNYFIIDDLHMQLQMSEPIDMTVFDKNSNISVSPSLNIRSIAADAQNKSFLNIEFESPIITNLNYNLTLKNIKDLKGNLTIATSINFSNIQIRNPKYHQVIITEFMADPSPVIALPEAEYVEIYNRTKEVLDLSNVSLADGTGKHRIGNVLILPEQFLILCNNKDSAAFKRLGPTHGMMSFPSINNSEDLLYLADDKSLIIDALNFTDDWYQSSSKKNGGYALELINDQDLCIGPANWSSSNHPSGGTPGRINSIWDPKTTQQSLKVVEVFALNEYEIKLIFNRVLDELDIINLSHYSIAPTNSIAAAELVSSSKQEVILLLDQALVAGKQYEISIQGILDCDGAAMKEKFIFDVVLPADPSASDLVINEVLFNPKTGGVSYIEFYNRSDKLLRTNSLFLANLLGDSLAKPIQLDRVIKPKTYFVLSKNPRNIIDNYPRHDSAVIFESNIPTLSDKEGIIKLSVYQSNKFETIDQFHYSDKLHNPLLDTKEGVSLERINPYASTSMESNWQSCAQTYGYGSPGIKNSQYHIKDSVAAKSNIVLSSSYITPNGDGDKDFVLIYFNNIELGSKLHLTIYDLGGNPVRQLSQDLIGVDDQIAWDGTDANQTLVASGNYIIVIELISAEGYHDIKKEVLAVITE